MNKQAGGDPTMTWVMGIIEPGWYVARWIWNEKYAQDLRDMGYRVERSILKPEVA